MEGYKCTKCYKIGITSSFLTNHFCYPKPIEPILSIKKIPKVNNTLEKYIEKTNTSNYTDFLPER